MFCPYETHIDDEITIKNKPTYSLVVKLMYAIHGKRILLKAWIHVYNFGYSYIILNRTFNKPVTFISFLIQRKSKREIRMIKINKIYKRIFTFLIKSFR